MARYIPTDETGRKIATQWLKAQLMHEFGQTDLARQVFHVIVGEMDESGACAVTLQANAPEFNVRTWIDDTDVIEGAAWIDGDGADPRADYRFGDGLELGTFMQRNVARWT